MAAKIVAFFLASLLPFLLTRRLDQVQLGLYKQVFLVVNTAVNVLPFGFAMSAFYFLPREHDCGRQIVFNILLIHALVGGLAFSIMVGWPGLIPHLLQSPGLVPFSRSIGFLIWVWTVASVLDIIAVAHQDTVSATAFIVIAQLSRTFLFVGTAVIIGTVESLIYAAILQAILQTCILLIYVRRSFPLSKHSFTGQLLWSQLSYALPLGAGGVLFSLQNDLHNYFVSHNFGPASFAVYSVGCFQLPFISMLGDSVGYVMIPRVSALQKLGNTREILDLTARAVRKLSAVYFPTYVLFLVVGRDFIALFFTSAYLPSWPIFVINITLIPVFAFIYDPVLRAYSESRYIMLRIKVVIFAAMVTVLWFGTNYLGLVGVIAVVITANLVERLVAMRLAIKLLGATRDDLRLLGDTAKLAIAALGAGFGTAVARLELTGAHHFTILAVCGIVFTLSYLVLVYKLDIVTPGEVATLRNLLTSVLSQFELQAQRVQALFRDVTP